MDVSPAAGADEGEALGVEDGEAVPPAVSPQAAQERSSPSVSARGISFPFQHGNPSFQWENRPGMAPVCFRWNKRSIPEKAESSLKNL